MKIHPNTDSLERLLAALAGPRDRRVVAHLLDCASCRERLRSLLAQDSGEVARVLPWPTSGYRKLLDRVIERAQEAGLPLKRDQAEAPVLLGELLLLPRGARLRAVAEDERLHSWALADLLLDRSRDTSFNDPERGERLARLGLAVIETLHPDKVDPALTADLRGRGLSFLANALRMRSDLVGAETAMSAARESLAAGTGDPLELARLLDLEASLRKDQNRFDEAAVLLQRAISGYRSADETRRAGRALITLAELYRCAGRPQKALDALRRADRYLATHGTESRLHLCARHTLGVTLTDLGRYLEAQRVFRDSAELYARFPDPWAQRRRLWLEGRILYGLDRPEAAEAALSEARRGFLEQEIVYDAALVSLDLAAVYARRGRAGELRRLAREMLPIFSARGVHREAQRALAYFQRAAEMEDVSESLVRGVLSYLQRARNDPGLRFDT